MKSDRNVIVHVEWGKNWSGGAKQVLLLVQGLQQDGISVQLACVEGSIIAQRAKENSIATTTFSLKGEHDLPTWVRFAKWLKVFLSFQTRIGFRCILHVHSRRGMFQSLFIGKILNLPTVLHWRVSAPLRFTINKLADVVIAISEAATEKVRQTGIASERIFLVRSAVDAEAFSPDPKARQQARSSLELSDENFVVASTGRLTKGKGHDLLLRAISMISSKDRPIVLMAGDGEEKPFLQKLSESLGISGWVRFLGFQGDVRLILWASDVFVHVPTKFPEGMSVAILEAMASELPVIATPVGGIVEIVRSEETGLLVPCNNVTALAEAVLRLKYDPPLRKQLSKSAKDLIYYRHTAAVMVKQTRQIYDQIFR